MKTLKCILILECVFFSVIIAEMGYASDKHDFCQHYAARAVQQYQQGMSHHLAGIVPPVWSNDRNGHYRWCLGTPENVVSSETSKRQAYLDRYIHSAKDAASKSKAGANVQTGFAAVAATPISIPRPIQPGHPKVAGAVSAQTVALQISRAELIGVDGNRMHIRFRYETSGPAGAEMYGGAFLHDAAMHPLPVGYQPTQAYRGAAGSMDVVLNLPSQSFQVATLETFIMRSGKVIGRQYFKMPYIWTGTWGGVVHPSRIQKPGQKNGSPVSPIAKKVTGNGSMPGMGKIGGKIGGNLGRPPRQTVPIGLDPGRGP